MTDPMRLRDDSETLAALRDDLDRVQGLTPNAYDTNAGLARLHGAVAAGAATAAFQGAVWSWLAVAGLVSATWLGYSIASNERSVPAQVAQRAKPPIIVHSGAEVVRALPVPSESTPQQQTVPPAPALSAVAAPPDSDALLRMETAHLARARAALEPTPAEALRLAQQGQRRFAGGMFGQERQAIIVLSALRLHQPSAEDAARVFLNQYPHGPLADRIRQELPPSPETR